MKSKKTTINIPIDTFNELNKEATDLGIPFSSLILIKLNQLKEQKEGKDLLINLLNNNELKTLIELAQKESKN